MFENLPKTDLFFFFTSFALQFDARLCCINTRLYLFEIYLIIVIIIIIIIIMIEK